MYQIFDHVDEHCVFKAIVIHFDRDDGNPERDPNSTGSAGARVGCCALQIDAKYNLNRAKPFFAN